MDHKQLFATKKLKEVREQKEMTQQEMADTLALLLDRSVSHSTYQKWEQGSVPIPLKDAITISRQLKTNIKELWRSK